MYNQSIADVVDEAIDRNRTCGACGTANTIRTEQDRVFVVCPKIAEPPRTVLGRLTAALFPHDRVLILP